MTATNNEGHSNDGHEKCRPQTITKDGHKIDDDGHKSDHHKTITWPSCLWLSLINAEKIVDAVAHYNTYCYHSTLQTALLIN